MQTFRQPCLLLCKRRRLHRFAENRPVLLGLQIYRVNTYLPISDRLVLRECRTIPLRASLHRSAHAVCRETSRSGFGSAVHVRSLHGHADPLRAYTRRSVYKFIAQTRICRFLTGSLCVTAVQSHCSVKSKPALLSLCSPPQNQPFRFRVSRSCAIAARSRRPVTSCNRLPVLPAEQYSRSDFGLTQLFANKSAPRQTVTGKAEPHDLTAP